jgi:hypothetical protein
MRRLLEYFQQIEFVPLLGSNGMDQKEADDKHRRAGYAMNGERSRFRPARPQND